MGAPLGENRFKDFQNRRSEQTMKSIAKTVMQLQEMNISFSNIHSASICVSEYLKKLDDTTVHRSPSTLLKNLTFRLSIQALVKRSSAEITDNRDSLISQIKIKRLQDEVTRLTNALAIKPVAIASAQAAPQTPADNGDVNRLCILISEILKYADFLFEVDSQKRIITKAGKYSSERFITSSENTSPYFDWLNKKASQLHNIGIESD